MIDFADFADFSFDFADFDDFSSDFADFLVLNLVYLCYDIKDQKVNLAGLKLVCSLCVKHQRKIRKKISKIRKIRSGDRALETSVIALQKPDLNNQVDSKKLTLFRYGVT